MRGVAFCGLLLVLCCVLLPVFAQDAAGDVFIAFVATREGNEDIFITTLDNRLTYNLTNARSRDWHPTWSPDGTQLAFISDRDGNQEIYVMQANGSEQRNLSRSATLDTSPDWSPVSSDIVFVSDRDGGFDLYILSATDGSVLRLTTDGAPKSDPDWSPDGTKVAYWELTATDTAALKYVTVADGAVTTVIAAGQNLWPAWSQDGASIAYHTPEGNGVTVIRRVTLADGVSVALTDGTADDLRPDWSPDGAQIVFMSKRDGNYNLYIMNADGSGQHRLTDVDEDDTSPSWQPRSALIDFSNTAVGLSATRVTSAIDAALQTKIGPADVRASVPKQSNLDTPIPIRLEVAVAGVALGDVDGDTSMSEGEIIASQFMGARLTGSALSKFEVVPGYLEYVQVIQPDQVNIWEWHLLPKGPETLGKSFLAIEVYLPDLASGEVDTEVLLTTKILQFEVVRFSEDSQPERADPSAWFRVQYTNDQYLAIVFDAETDVSGLSVLRPRRKPLPISEIFPSVEAYHNNIVPAGTCLYIIVGDARPLLPEECRTDSALSQPYNIADVFWIQGGVLVDVIFQHGEGQTVEPYMCLAANAPTWCEPR